MMSREKYLLSNENPLAKSGEKSKFDVPIGLYDDAEIYELIGLIILNKIKSPENSKKNPSSQYIQNIGLCRDNN